MKHEGRVLTIAAANGRVGYVFLDDTVVLTWGLSRKASRGPDEAAARTAQWLETLRPDVVITEKITRRNRKGDRTKAVIAAIRSVAEMADVLAIEVARVQSHQNKFEEAVEIAAIFPELARLVPKYRKPWQTEPKTTVYFEAAALVLSAFGDPRRRP
ncbi:MAG: hypothetical protein RID91_03570 [Azospirillaceae bacterium]